MNSTEQEKLSKDCLANCLPKCKQTTLKTSDLRERDKYTPLKFKKLLNQSTRYLGQDSPTFLDLMHKINSSPNPLEVSRQYLPNIAHVTFFFRNEQQQLVLEIKPFMTFAQFLSNVGGLMELWLGLSVISAIELVEVKVSTLCKRTPAHE